MSDRPALATSPPGAAPEGADASKAGAPPTGHELRAFFEGRAQAVDAGIADPRDALRHLSAHGLLEARDLRTSFELLRFVAASDLASAFTLWSHTMVLQCIAGSSTPELLELADRLRQATAWGSTAMASTIKHLAGLGELPITYRRHGSRLVLEGRIPWASNLFDENVVLVLAARSTDEPMGASLVLAVDGRDPTVGLGRPLPLLALEATASSAVELHSTPVTTSAVISSDLPAYMRSMKPRLLLLQTAYCLGLADAATTAGADRLTRAATIHRTEHAELADRVASLSHEAELLADAVDQRFEVANREVVDIRLRAAQAAQTAVELELRLTGGSGFVASSPTARRYREAAFLPVQTPTEGQLITELG